MRVGALWFCMAVLCCCHAAAQDMSGLPVAKIIDAIEASDKNQKQTFWSLYVVVKFSDTPEAQQVRAQMVAAAKAQSPHLLFTPALFDQYLTVYQVEERFRQPMRSLALIIDPAKVEPRDIAK